MFVSVAHLVCGDVIESIRLAAIEMGMRGEEDEAALLSNMAVVSAEVSSAQSGSRCDHVVAKVG
jgi:hypothetical protein